MRKIVLLAALGAMLGGCVTPGAVPVTSPAPLASTAIDDTALRTAWLSFEIAVDGITLLRQSGVIKAGSAKAVKIAIGIERVTLALEAAEHAVAALSKSDYLDALNEARLAIADLRLALKGN